MKPTFLFRWVLDYFITIKKFLWTRNGGTVSQYMLLKGLWAGYYGTRDRGKKRRDGRGGHRYRESYMVRVTGPGLWETDRGHPWSRIE